MAQTFAKTERLSSFTQINLLLKDGSVSFVYPFRITYRINTDGSTNRVIVSVPKKNFKRAVHRNLLKRRIREAYRKNKELFFSSGNICIDFMFVYVAKEILDYRYIETKIKDILGKVSKTVETDC